MTQRWFAPGKVVVAGEYAVVDGAPALVAAVDIGVAVAVCPFPMRQVVTPTGDSRFVDAALDAVEPPPARWVFTHQGGPPLASKPGLGGSAAATVVAVYAARALAGLHTAPATVFTTAFEVHHRVQGSGSGIDVAASTYGGMLRFQPAQLPQPIIAPRLVVVWTGQSAATGPRVKQYQAWSGRSAFVQASTAIVDAFADDPIGALRANGDLLSSMADAAGIAYRTPALDAIAALAADHGGAAKPSGAGGGDSAVAILPDIDREQAFVRACEAAGWVVLATTVAPGVGPAPVSPIG